MPLGICVIEKLFQVINKRYTETSIDSPGAKFRRTLLMLSAKNFEIKGEGGNSHYKSEIPQWAEETMHEI